MGFLPVTSQTRAMWTLRYLIHSQLTRLKGFDARRCLFASLTSPKKGWR
jgi:hypothetical protein